MLPLVAPPARWGKIANRVQATTGYRDDVIPLEGIVGREAGAAVRACTPAARERSTQISVSDEKIAPSA